MRDDRQPALHDALRSVYAGRRFVVATPVIQEAGALAKQVLDLGAEACLLLAARPGTGAPPDASLGEQHILGLPPTDTMRSIHGAERAFRDLPADVLSAIERFDPRGDALALGAFFGNGQPIAGRRVVGARPVPWQALEDKTTVDALWEAAGLPHATHAVVPVDDAPAAARRFDRGAGTVWAADNREGFHGGASHTLHVADAASEARALGFLRAHADRVRVMPFLRGVPCSIHGLVLPDDVLAFRPAEMIVLQRADFAGFYYMGAATTWDPTAAQRDALRALARRVGTHLRETLGYRGAFTIDGVMTADGFLPTELNPRVGAAMGHAVRGVSLPLLHYALIEGMAFPGDARAWEADRVHEADAERVARLGFGFAGERSDTHNFALRRTASGALVEQEGDEGADILGMIGPGPSGSRVHYVIRPSQYRTGDSLAPLAAELVAWTDAHLGSHIGPLHWTH